MNEAAEIKSVETNDKMGLEVKKRVFDNRWCVWAPYESEETSLKWQLVSTHGSKDKAKKFVRKYVQHNSQSC